jgi:Fe(3+) dicitrate transport protein
MISSELPSDLLKTVRSLAACALVLGAVGSSSVVQSIHAQDQPAAGAARAPSATAAIEGIVSGPAGEPLADVQVTVTRANARVVAEGAGAAAAGTGDGSRGGDVVAGAITDQAGRYRIALPGGDGAGDDEALYTVTAWGAGYATATRTGVRGGREEVLRLDFSLAEQPIRLPGVEVVGEAPEALAKIPGSTGVIGAETLERSRPLSAREVLRETPGVHVKEEDAFGLLLNVGVRGLDARRSSRVLLLEDGMPINLGPYSDPSARYHPLVEGLERIEVLKGSGQILHGPHTVGGVINFVRSNPPSEPGGSITLSGGSRDFFSGHLNLGGRWNGMGAVLDYARRQGRGAAAHQRHAVDDLAVKGALAIGGRQLLSLKGAYYSDDSRAGDAGLTQAEFEAEPHANPFPDNAYRVRRHAAQAVHEWSLADHLLLRTNLYAQRASFTTWRQAGSSTDRLGQPGYTERFNCRPEATSLDDCGTQGNPRTYSFWGLEPRLSATHALFGIESEADIGVRLHVETVHRRQFLGERPDSRSGEITRDNAIETRAFTAFLQNRLLAGDWSVTPGMRLEHVRSENVNRLEDSRLEDAYTRWLPGLGLAFNGLPGATLFAGVHRGFAPPRPAEVLNPRPGAGLVQVDPEVSWNYEVGLRSRPVSGVELEATLFGIDFENQIIRGSLVGSGQTFVNAGETVHRGVELAGAADVGALLGIGQGIYAHGAYTRLVKAEFVGTRTSAIDSEVLVTGNQLPYAPEHVVRASLGYEHPSGLSLRLDADHVSRQFSDDLNTVASSEDGQQGVIPAYTVFNAAASYALEPTGVTLYVTVKNLTDRVYITDRQEGIVVGAPRLMVAGAKWSF